MATDFDAVFFRNLPSSNADAIVTGYCAGVLADGRLDESELAGLQTLIAHCGVSDPVRDALDAMLRAWQGGKCTLTELAAQMRRLAGGELAEGEALLACTLFCADPVPKIDFTGTFVFTGEFSTLTRSELHDIAMSLGGTARKSMSADVDYLIVGTSAPPAYANGTWGRKIEKAMKLQADGQCAIVSEDAYMEQKFIRLLREGSDEDAE